LWYADGDGDGYGAGEPVEACTAPEGYVASAEDCDDARADINPAAAETDCADPTDYNCDGSTGFADNDGDGFPACEDCDDGDGAVNPDGVELCDGLDNNCDGLTDGADALDAATYYQDRDGDSYGDVDFAELACAAPEGYAAQAGDCDDGAAAVNPSATEVCNSLDDDCDEAIDEDDAADAGAWYADNDGDGFGDPGAAQLACEAPEGSVADATDCDDAEGTVNPDAAEVCDGQDNNCDGAVDEDSAADAATWYSDADEDGFGDAGAAIVACDQPSGAVADASDCDDGQGAVNPDATERCDGQDNDCDGDVDEPDAADASTWYSDADSDGYGDAGAPVLGCDAPSGTVADATDCDDGDVGVNPGEAEVYYDGVDADCDEASDYDADGDGDDAELYGGGDCDDGDAGAYTGLNCRPDPGCVSVSLTTLAAKDPSGGSDLVYDDSCAAYVSSHHQRHRLRLQDRRRRHGLGHHRLLQLQHPGDDLEPGGQGRREPQRQLDERRRPAGLGHDDRQRRQRHLHHGQLLGQQLHELLLKLHRRRRRQLCVDPQLLGQRHLGLCEPLDQRQEHPAHLLRPDRGRVHRPRRRALRLGGQGAVHRRHQRRVEPGLVHGLGDDPRHRRGLQRRRLPGDDRQRDPALRRVERHGEHTTPR
jgi:hypothetical protein